MLACVLLQIVDNAPIHVSKDVFGILLALLDYHGIGMIRLPKYSPEYNPCELVWAQVNRH
jgi:transposase